jgi:O-antigen/teichoic acid export membrane protein
MDLPAQLTGLSIVLSVSNILLNILFIPRFGIEGAALATASSSGFMAVMALWKYSKYHKIELDWYSLLWGAVASGIMALCIFALQSYISPDTIVKLLVTVFTGAVIYFSVLFAIPYVRTEARSRFNLLTADS